MSALLGAPRTGEPPAGAGRAGGRRPGLALRDVGRPAGSWQSSSGPSWAAKLLRRRGRDVSRGRARHGVAGAPSAPGQQVGARWQALQAKLAQAGGLDLRGLAARCAAELPEVIWRGRLQARAGLQLTWCHLNEVL